MKIQDPYILLSISKNEIWLILWRPCVSFTDLITFSPHSPLLDNYRFDYLKLIISLLFVCFPV